MIPTIWGWGQSNEDGTYDVASTTGYPANGYADPFPAVTMMESRANAPTDPVVERGPVALSPRPGGTAGLFGAELSMCRDLTAAGITHNFGKTSVRGSSLYSDWPTVIGFDRLFSHMRAGVAQMDAKIRGLIVKQGEADAGNAGGAAAWASNFATNILTPLRDEFGGDVWCIIVLIHSGSGGAFNTTVRAQQQLVAATYPRVRVIDASDLAIIGAHYTADATITLGSRLATAVQAIWNPTYSSARRKRGMYAFKRSNPIAAQRTLFFVAVDEADLQARLAGLSGFTVRIKKPGLAEAAAANAPVEVDAADMEGVYSLELSTAEIDTDGHGVVVVSKAGMETREIPFVVEPAQFGTVTSGTLTAAAFSTNLSQANDYWRDGLVKFITGNLAGQVKKIGAFANAGGVITLATGLTFTAAPTAGEVVQVINE
jgi:hypothetical protein